MSNFSNILKSLRKASNLTQEELANSLKVSRSTIGMYENASREPDYEQLEAIADFFNVDTDYLLGRTTTKRKVLFDEFGDKFITPSPNTLAAHFEGEEFTDAELEEISNFVKFVKAKRDN